MNGWGMPANSVDAVVQQAEFYESQGVEEWRAVRRAVEDAKHA